MILFVLGYINPRIKLLISCNLILISAPSTSLNMHFIYTIKEKLTVVAMSFAETGILVLILLIFRLSVVIFSVVYVYVMMWLNNIIAFRKMER